MVLHPIYQQELQGGYDPLVLSASTERMLLHPSLTKTTGRRLWPPVGMFPALAPPYHPGMFLFDFKIFFMYPVTRFPMVFVSYMDLDHIDDFSHSLFYL